MIETSLYQRPNDINNSKSLHFIWQLDIKTLKIITHALHLIMSHDVVEYRCYEICIQCYDLQEVQRDEFWIYALLKEM